jgi:PAS domain S-box-containing protein
MNKDKYLKMIPDSKLLQKAANASSEGITISTMSLPDRPLIYVNEGFQKITGYTREEVIGRNCRFLQGEGTDPLAVQELREAIRKGESCTVELLNFRKNGEPFWNRLSITPIHNQEKMVTHYVGIQSDITQLRETQANVEIANKELKIFQERILKELDQAKLVQRFLLPAHLPSTSKVEFASLFVPMDEIGGDFFDVVELSGHHKAILIADVTGHGIPAALLTFMSSMTFKNAATDLFSPAKTIQLTNKGLYSKMPGDTFVTMFYAIYDSSRRILTYAQAGHPEGYILRPSSNEIIPLSTGGTLIGVLSDEEVSFEEKEIDLLPGDKLILYTDAITDTLERYYDNEMGTDLPSLLLKNAKMSLHDLFNYVYDYGLKCSKSTAYPDDFTLVGMEVLE